MAYVALKPCCFDGLEFRIGANIPEELIHPGAAKNLVKMGLIAEQGESSAHGVHTDGAVSIRVQVEEGELPLEITREGLQETVNALTGTVSDAEKTIREMNDNDALILLHLCDSRKSIKAAAEARAKELNHQESAGEP